MIGRSVVTIVSTDTTDSSSCTGKERDAETGLDWMKTRYFSGAQGRFTSPDKPFADQMAEDPQSWNLYSYVRNNPLKLVDEDGESATLAGAIGGGIVGAGIAAWRGESVWKGAVSGAAAGALAGSVIDTFGASAVAIAASGAVGGGAGYLLDTGLNGGTATGTGLATATAVGTVGALGGAAIGKAVTVVGQRLAGPSAASETLRPGPYASESIPASGPKVTPAEAAQLKGQPCHTCGNPVPGTKSGNPVGDHQPPTNLMNTGNAARRLYPQCTTCSFPRQANQVQQQNYIWRQQQTSGTGAGAGAGAATGTRRPEDEH